MTPGARTQAAIELLDQIFTSWQSEKRFPADKLLDSYFKARRYIGSKDRGAIAELVYWILRNKAALEWWLKRERVRMHGRTYVFAALALRKDYHPEAMSEITKDSRYSPSPFIPDEVRLIKTLSQQKLEHPDMPEHVRLNYPEWMEVHLKESFGEATEAAAKALNDQAPTDLRVNTLKTTRDALLESLRKEGYEVSATPLSPLGIRLAKRAPIFTSAYFKEGHFEVQDEGSQLVTLLVEAGPGQRIIDFCAGAGGKTLAIAAAMKNKGRILAWDTSEKRLKQISQRLKRAGVDNVEMHVITSENDSFIKRHKGTADRVLVDAPCSGSGTWRRNPDLKWRFLPKDLDEVALLQQSILDSAARLVKPNGWLIYVTCSIMARENERQIEEFLRKRKDFAVVSAQKIWDNSRREAGSSQDPYLRLTPHQDGTDGFFASVLERLPNKLG